MDQLSNDDLVRLMNEDVQLALDYAQKNQTYKEVLALARAKLASLDTPPSRHGKPWDREEEERLADGFRSGKTIQECARLHDRSVGGITAKLSYLGLTDKFGVPLTQIDSKPAETKRAELLELMQKAREIKRPG
jgi:hypothetical protein